MIYTRAGCHLCEVAIHTAREVLAEMGSNDHDDGRLHLVDVDADPELLRRFGERVPVVMVGEREIAEYRVSAGQLRRALGRRR
ncbi:MAG: glutaredoxin family protein [Bowdeniella nasicola]|nr:glutaredoxin family protein [Bowdeniella nasicola]